MPTVIQIRRDTKAGWNVSLVLAAGEIGYETDTGNFKVGDGTTIWSSLAYQMPYINTGAGNRTSTVKETLVVNHETDRVGIGTDTPTEKLSVTGNAAVSGNITAGGTLGVTGNVAVNTDKFNITAASGNTTVAGTLGVTGLTTLSNDLAINAATNADITTTTATATVFNTNATTLNIGGAATAVSIGAATGTTTINNANTAITGSLALATNKFTVAAATGNTVVAGTLGVTGNVAVNSDKFNITAASVNTTVAGTLDVTGKLTYPYPQVVMNNVTTPTYYSGPTASVTLLNNSKVYAATISALDTSITPRYSTSKILLNFSFAGEFYETRYAVDQDNAMFLLYRVVGGTETELTTSAQEGSRQAGFKSVGFDTEEIWHPINYNFVYLDSPSTTSAVTYRLKFWDVRAWNAGELKFSLNASRDYFATPSVNTSNIKLTTSQVVLQEYFA